MSNRHVPISRLCLISGWVLVCAAAPAQPPEERLAAAEERSARALETIASNPPPDPQPDPGCEPGDDLRQSDLCAQWKAADKAHSSARWAFWSFLTSLAALGAAIAAAIFTWRTVKHASDTAAMARQDQVLRNRPALWVGQVRLDLQPDVELQGTVLIHNQGNSDATFTARCLGYKVWKSPAPATPVQEFQGLNFMGEPTLGPSTQSYEKWAFRLDPLSAAEYRKIKSGAEKFYLIGRLVYTFTDGVPEHHSIFAFVYDRTSGKFELMRDRDFTFGVVVDDPFYSPPPGIRP